MIAKIWNWKSPTAKFGSSFWRMPFPLTSLSDESEPKIGVLSDSFQSPIAFEALGLPYSELDLLDSRSQHDPAFREVFAVYRGARTVDAETKALAPVSGNYVIDGARLTFIPLSPLRPGETYRIVLQAGDSTFFAGASRRPTTIEREVTVPIQSN